MPADETNGSAARHLGAEDPPSDRGADNRTPKLLGKAAREARLRAIVNHVVDGIITIDEDGIIEDMNPAVLDLFGYQADELIGENVKILMPMPYRREHDQYLRNYRETGQRKIIGIGRDVAGRRKDGSEFPVALTVSEAVVDGRRLFTGVVRDVTDRKRVELEHQRFASLVENASDAIVVASLDWQIVYLNSAGQRLIGVRPEMVTTLELRDLWDEDTLPIVMNDAIIAQRRGESFRFQGRIVHFETRKTIDIDCNAFPILDNETSKTSSIAFAIRDIREQKQVEQALRDGEARIAAVLDSAVDGIITINERGDIETLNPSALKIFGYTTEELIGKNVKILMPPPYHDEHDQYLRNYRHTGERKIIGIGREVIGLRKDGTTFPMDLSVSEVVLGNGRLFTGIVRDITERKEAERHRNLLDAELSHRVKNLLATVMSISRQSLKEGRSIAEARDVFEGRLLALSKTHNRLADSEWRGVNIEDVLRDILSPYLDSDGENIQVAGPSVEILPRLAVTLGMAVHELATNAAKYGALSRSSGSIEIAWSVMQRSGGDQLRIDWREHGVGDVTKPSESGFGLLLLERGLAHDLKGKVQLDFTEEGLHCTILCPL